MFWKKEEQAKAEGIAWFNYAVMLPDMDDDEREITIIGNFIIQNIGSTVLNNPIICIRTTPSKYVRLGGKIGSTSHTALMIDGTNAEAWKFLHDNWKDRSLESGEHILKPIHCRQLEPGQLLSFANEVCMAIGQQQSFVLVEGFFYCDEIKNGIPALNTMTVNL